MPFKWSTVAIGSALSIFSVGPFLERTIVPAVAGPTSVATNGMLLNLGTGKARLLEVPGATSWVTAQTEGVQTFAPVLSAPGAYKTEPFTCIVVVPQQHIDDASVVFPTEGASKMPIVQPRLDFVPIK